VNPHKFGFAVVGLALLCGVAAVLGGCGSSSTPPPPNFGFVNTGVSDPPTCLAPNGPYSHVFVTVTDVQASTSTDPNANSGFVDLTPGLKPTQIDLLGSPNGVCLLAALGSNVQVPAGTYEQFRVILLANNQASQVTNNQCGPTAANCVVLASNNSVQTLLLSSEAQTGIKIPASQISGGQFTVPANQTVDLVIDFDACASIVIQGNGQYRLKPVLHAGEVSATSSTIKGTVVDSLTKLPLVGGTVLVALEQNKNGIDRVIMETRADVNGNFIFCPVAMGSYDVVAVGINGAGVAYAATVITGVPQGTTMGNVSLVAETTTNTTQASLQGMVTTSTGSAGTVADLTLSALQPISGTVMATIPLVQQGSATASLTTAAGVSCPANTDCISYTLGVPAANPAVGAFGGAAPIQAGGAVNYSVDALAFVPMSGGTPNCTPSELTTNMTTTNTPLTVTPGTTSNPATLAFTGCQ
jgi:uncharacterized protein DUF4382